MLRTAADLMEQKVITIRSSASLRELALLFEEEGIHGVPVVDAADNPIGVVSRYDLVTAMTEDAEPIEPTRRYYAIDEEELDAEDLSSAGARAAESGAERTVADIMSTEIVSARPGSTVGQVAKLMARERVHRVLILDGKKLVGIVSSSDVLQCMADYEKRLELVRFALEGTGRPANSRAAKPPAAKSKAKDRLRFAGRASTAPAG